MMSTNDEAQASKRARSVGIIMDGNRRWAKANHLPSFEGHRHGYDKLREVIEWSRESGIHDVIVYAFSTENWNRAKEEVAYLMDLLRGAIGELAREAKKNNTRIIALGERRRLPHDILVAIAKAEDDTRECTGMNFGIALSYGGRAEIIDAISRLPAHALTTLSEEEFSGYLWTKELKDPDIIIRTSGEKRLSGFLLWQSAYSELFFTETYWPDLTKEEFLKILADYGERERRYGE